MAGLGVTIFSSVCRCSAIRKSQRHIDPSLPPVANKLVWLGSQAIHLIVLECPPRAWVIVPVVTHDIRVDRSPEQVANEVSSGLHLMSKMPLWCVCIVIRDGSNKVVRMRMTDKINENWPTYVPIISFGGIKNMYRSLFSRNGQCGDTAVLSTCNIMSKVVGGIKKWSNLPYEKAQA